MKINNYHYGICRRKAWRTVMTVLLCFVLCAACFGCSQSTTPEFCDSDGIYPAYDQLSGNPEKAAYTALYEAVLEQRDEAELSGISADKVNNIYYAVKNDHPELFFSISSYLNFGNKTFKANLVYPENSAEKTAAVKAAADRILAECEGKELFQQVLTVHDIIVSECVYDREAYMSGYKEKYADSYTAYGCLVNHLSVCAGYADAFLYIMHRLGIRCGCVTGGDHEWNYLKLDGKYYYMDVTWDDPAGEEDTISYDYFCITEAEMLETHTVDGGQPLPHCDATDMNYYIKKGLFIEAYSRDAVKPLIEKGVTDGVADIKFASSEIGKQAKSDLIDGREIWNILQPIGYHDGYSYYFSKDGRVLHLEFNK